MTIALRAADVEITVGDDGLPHQQQDWPQLDRGWSGNGLRGMSERASAFDGTVLAGPTPAGWRVLCILPRPVRVGA